MLWHAGSLAEGFGSNCFWTRCAVDVLPRTLHKRFSCLCTVVPFLFSSFNNLRPDIRYSNWRVSGPPGTEFSHVVTAGRKALNLSANRGVAGGSENQGLERRGVEQERISSPQQTSYCLASLYPLATLRATCQLFH